MKILFPLGAFYPSQIGGPCNTLYWHTCALKTMRFQPRILTTNTGIKQNTVNLNKWSQKKCGSVYYVDNGSFSKLRYFKELFKEVKNADLIHLNSLFSYYSIVCFLYTKLFYKNKSIVWSVRGELNPNALKYSNWKKKPVLALYKRLNKNITYHSTSKEETLGIQTFFPNTTVVELPNYIEPEERLKLHIEKQLLYLGRIHPIKGLEKLIEALSLSDSFISSDFKMIIAGKHEERHESYFLKLKKQINLLNLTDKVIFKGQVEGKEKEKLYATSYFFILPSETENFGNVVIESLNQGTPVLASLGTPWSVLEDYNAGYHTSNKPENLSAIIDRIIHLEPDDYFKMRENAYNFVVNNFNVHTQIINWVSIYKNLNNENQK